VIKKKKPNRSQVKQMIQVIIAKVLKVDPFWVTERADFAVVLRQDGQGFRRTVKRIIARIEKEFSIKIPSVNLGSITTLEKAQACVWRNLR
jgi:hypothetical protein